MHSLVSGDADVHVTTPHRELRQLSPRAHSLHARLPTIALHGTSDDAGPAGVFINGSHLGTGHRLGERLGIVADEGIIIKWDEQRTVFASDGQTDRIGCQGSHVVAAQARPLNRYLGEEITHGIVNVKHLLHLRQPCAGECDGVCGA